MAPEERFPYGEKEIAHLIKKDTKLGAFINEVGMIKRTITPDLFTSLAGSLVSQQISTVAAAAIFGRLKALCQGNVCPRIINELDIMEIKACGLSLKKSENIKSAAEAILSGTLSLEKLPTLSDQEVIEELVSLKGVGVWTAEMLMIFSLKRPNILSFGDLGIQNGIKKIYGWKTLSKKRLQMLHKRYSPYASTASLYLWHAAGMKP